MNGNITKQISLLSFSCNSETLAHIPIKDKQTGFSGEVRDYIAFEDAGLMSYMKKHNPMISFEGWSKTLQNGCDFVFKVGRKIFKIEASTIGRSQCYHQSWFKWSRLKRLLNTEYTIKPHGAKKNPFYVTLIWLINNPDLMRNLTEMRNYAKGFGVLLLTVTETISLLESTIASTTVNNANTNYSTTTNTYTSTINISTNNSLIIQDNNKKAEIDDLNPDREVDKYKKLGLFNDYGFSS